MASRSSDSSSLVLNRSHFAGLQCRGYVHRERNGSLSVGSEKP